MRSPLLYCPLYAVMLRRFLTVMSYDDNCPRAPEINYFSNPDVSYRGLPTGTATENNARKIRETMVSQFAGPVDAFRATT